MGVLYVLAIRMPLWEFYMYWQSGRHYGSIICIDNQDATMGGNMLYANRATLFHRLLKSILPPIVAVFGSV